MPSAEWREGEFMLPSVFPLFSSEDLHWARAVKRVEGRSLVSSAGTWWLTTLCNSSTGASDTAGLWTNALPRTYPQILHIIENKMILFKKDKDSTQIRQKARI